MQLYQREAGSRLEAAFRSGRSSVPLAGLQPELDGAIVARLWKSVRGRLQGDHSGKDRPGGAKFQRWHVSGTTSSLKTTSPSGYPRTGQSLALKGAVGGEVA